MSATSPMQAAAANPARDSTEARANGAACRLPHTHATKEARTRPPKAQRGPPKEAQRAPRSRRSENSTPPTRPSLSEPVPRHLAVHGIVGTSVFVGDRVGDEHICVASRRPGEVTAQPLHVDLPEAATRRPCERLWPERIVESGRQPCPRRTFFLNLKRCPKNGRILLSICLCVLS